MIVKSITKVNLEDGDYHGIWDGLNVTVKNGYTFKVGRASKEKVGCSIKVKDGIASVNNKGRGLTKEEAEELFSDIDNYGLGDWILDGDFTNDVADPKLVALKKKAKAAVEEVDNHIQMIFNKNGID